MERITFEGLFCDIAQCVGEPGNTSECPGGYCDQRRTWERLKEYEDTGLTPEQVAAFAKDNNVPSKWIPVTERLPESQKIVLVSAKSKTHSYRHTLMVAHIGDHEATTEDYGWQEYEGDTEYDEEKDCFWIPECWWEVNSVEDNGNWIIDSDYEVTHWMPLPEPPKEAAK